MTNDWLVCAACDSLLYRKRFERHLQVCPECGHHAPLTAPCRIDQLLDAGSAKPLEVAALPQDPLGFKDTKRYPERLREAQVRTGLDEAVLCVRGTIEEHAVIVAVMDFRFMGGSLGSAVGELITQAAEHALRDRTPLLIVSASGGARMQEGAVSLMQMAKTSQALAQLDEAGVLTISLITDPTYGGVTASFATLCDVIVAEPGARMGFAGPRVIEQTIKQALPAGFQTAEYLLARGLIDDIQPRASLRTTLAQLLTCARPGNTADSRGLPAARRTAVLRDAAQVPADEAWNVVQRARHLDRPTTLDYVGYLFEYFHELHGDRLSGDCSAVVGGIGVLEGLPVMLIGHQKGHDTAQLMARNFGMATPAGYRKSARLMRLAGRLGLPVITLFDTPGAYPGIEAEDHGQAIAIAENLRLMSTLSVPVVTVVTGEGGSGGALGLGVADRVLMCANAIYSVISPEGCAAILWKDASMAATAAEALRLRAPDLLEAGIVDAVVAEPAGGAHADAAAAAGLLRDALTTTLGELLDLRPDQLVRQRRQRFRRIGAQGSVDKEVDKDVDKDVDEEADRETDEEGGQRDRQPAFVGPPGARDDLPERNPAAE
jgi:acetyl-CoA carboxylase carboxyl transferase alpha subunit/acetyl-CoA carboxylase carboxyl transferase beta subunit